MVLPSSGGSKVIEEIVLSIALPSISRSTPRMPSQMQRQTFNATRNAGMLTEISGVDPGESGTDGRTATGVPIESVPGGELDPMAKELSIEGEPGYRPKSDIPAPPKVTVVKIEELDLDAPPDFDQLKMNLVNVQQPQVIFMQGEKSERPEGKDEPGEGKEPTQESSGAQAQVPGGATVQLPPGTQHIYTVDPNVIKRLQWRLARMEDFETSIGIAVAEIKEAIAKAETTRLELEEMRKGYATVEKTMHELAALYDLISASVNPFIDSEQEQQTISTKIMKRTLGMETSGGAAATTAPAATAFPLPSFGAPTEMSPKKKEEKTADDYSVDTWTVKWAEFLLERIPKSKINALLDHYIEIGWLDEEIKARVEETIKGINEINLGIHASDDGADEDDRKKLDWWKLPIDDHVKSLQFIEKIRGGKGGGGFIPGADKKK